MTFRFKSAAFALSILPATAGETISSSSKSGLFLPADDYSAKGIVDSAKGTIDSAKSSIDIPELTPRRPSPWNLGFGLSGRKIGKIKFDTAPTRLPVPPAFGGSSFTPPSGIGPATGFSDRSYDNGFVNPGPRTPATGRTTDYGYQTGDQLQGDRLVYSADGGERRVVTTSESLSWADWSEDDDWEISPYLSLNRLTDLGNGWSAGPSFQLSFTKVDGSQGGTNTLNATEHRELFDVRAIDRYDSSGLVLPTPPYTGSPGAVAPLLPAEPVNRTFEDTLRSRENAVFSDSINEDLDINLFGGSLGVDAVYQSESKLITGLGTGIALNIVDWDANREDRLIQVTNGGPPVEVGTASFDNSGTDVLFGVYLEGTVGYRINDSWSIEGHARYDWSESLKDSVGESDFDVELSGFSLGLGASYSF